MRLLLLTAEAYGGHGGIALYNRDLARACAEMPEVEEVVVVPRNLPLPPGPLPAKVRFESRAAGSKARYIRKAMAVALERFHAVICGHINLLPIAAAVSQARRVPLALVVYGIDVWKPPGVLARRWLKAVDCIWSISGYTRDRMNRWAVLPDNRYTILPNAIALDRYGMARRRPELVERHRLAGSRVIMTLARLASAERYKGLDEVLDVLPGLLDAEPRLKYLVAGDGDDRPRLEAKARALGIADKVVFAGMIDERDKADYLRLADAFVMPGRGEGFGFVFLEAMACGIPVVGSLKDGSREALRDGQLGELVDPDDAVSLRGGILRALAKPAGIPPGLEVFAWPNFSARVARAVRAL